MDCSPQPKRGQRLQNLDGIEEGFGVGFTEPGEWLGVAKKLGAWERVHDNGGWLRAVRGVGWGGLCASGSTKELGG